MKAHQLFPLWQRPARVAGDEAPGAGNVEGEGASNVSSRSGEEEGAGGERQVRSGAVGRERGAAGEGRKRSDVAVEEGRRMSNVEEGQGCRMSEVASGEGGAAEVDMLRMALDTALAVRPDPISHKVFLKSFGKSQFPHMSVNLSLIITISKE